MPLTNVGLFLKIKETLRLHPDYTDDQVIESLDLRGPREAALVVTARKDLEAG